MRKLRTVVPDALMNPDVELKQEELKARIEELQGKIGMGLQPVIMDLLQNIVDISESEWVDDLVKGIEVLQGKHSVKMFEDLKLGILTVQTTWDVLVTDLGEGWQKFMDATGLAGTTFDGLVTDLGEGWQVIIDATEPFLDLLTDISDAFIAAVDQVAKVSAAIVTFATDAKAILGPIVSIINDIFGADHTATFQVNTGRAPRGSPGSGDRNTSNAVQREGLRTGMGAP